MGMDSQSRCTHIPPEEVRFEATSGLDNTGEVFHWNGGIYRGIRPSHSAFYSEILSGPIVEQLMASGLVATEIADCTLDGYGLVLKHKKIPVVSYASEWCTAMFKDAALLMSRFQEVLLPIGYTLKDGHPWNVLFDGAVPKFVDFGSIVPYEPRVASFFLREFRATFLYPLLLRSAGLGPYADSALVAHTILGAYDSPSKAVIYRALRSNIPARLWLIHRYRDYQIRRLWERNPSEALRQLQHQVRAIREEPRGEGVYQPKRGPPDRRAAALTETLEKLRPRSVIFIGIRDHEDALTAEAQGARVLVADVDDARLNKLYRYVAAHQLNILPVRMDITGPNLVHGGWGLCSAAEERFKCELVVLGSVIERLVRKRRISFAELTRYLSAFSKKWAIVRFDDQPWPGMEYWETLHRTKYNIESFKAHLRRQFSEVLLLEESEDSRGLLLCVR